MRKSKKDASEQQNSVGSIETFLNQLTITLKQELGCECFYEFKSIDNYKNDRDLKTPLLLFLMHIGLKIDDVINQSYYLCTIAIEIDEDDNVVSKRSDIHMNDWDVEHVLEKILNMKVTSFGAIIRNDRRFRTLRFLIQA